MGEFFIFLYIKSDMLGLFTSNALPSNNLRPFPAQFKIFIFYQLSATLSPFETSVPPGFKPFRNCCIGMFHSKKVEESRKGRNI